MRVLLTGDKGWAGRFVVPALEAAGHKIQTDLWRTPEAIVHMGARHRGSATDMLRNVKTTEWLVTTAPTDIPLIHFSSRSVYGTANGASIFDLQTPCVDPSPYGLSKLLSEALLDDRGWAISLRLPALIGKDSHSNWLSVMRQQANDHPADYFNRDQPFNAIVHIDDLCRYVCRLLASADFPKSHVRLVLGSPDLPTVKEVVNRISPRSRPAGAQPGHFIIDDSFARRHWGWDSMTTLEAVDKFMEDNHRGGQPQ